MPFTKRTQDILSSAGWYDGRKIEIKHIVDLLENRGFNVFESVKEFLKEFGMLRLDIPSFQKQETIKEFGFRKFDTHHTDVIKALGDAGDKDCIAPFEEFAGESMVIVGRMSNDNLWLMISQSGKVYCDSGKVGNNAIEAFELLCTREKSLVPWQNL